MKKLVFILFSFFFFLSCTKDSSEGGLSNDGQLNISLNLIKDFSLQLDQTTSKSNLLEDSDFQHVYDDEITVTFISDPPGYSQSLTFNPNSSDLQTVVLPYGEYNWEIPVDSNPTEISNTLSVYGQSTQTITINDPDINLSLDVNTDFALVTVNDDYTSNVTLTHEDLSISMNSKDGYNYGYVLSGTTSSSLSLIDTNGDSYTSDLGLIQSCKHYKYQLDYSNVGVNSLICLCEPFEVIERFLIPSSSGNICNKSDLPTTLQTGLRGMWTFCGNSNDMSDYSNNGTLYGPTNVMGKFNQENTAFQFNGTDNYISLSDSFFNESTSVSSFTFYTLVKVDQLNPTTAQHIFTKEGSWRTIYLSATRLDDGDYHFRFGGSQPSPQQYFGINSNLEYDINTWYNIVVTFYNGELKIYVDGELDNTTTTPMNSIDWSFLAQGNSTSTNHIGNALPNSGATKYFDGTIDDLIYWDRVLTQEEINLLNR